MSMVCMTIKASKRQMMMMNALNDQSIVDEFQQTFAEFDAEFQATCEAEFGLLANAAMMAHKHMEEAEEDTTGEAMEVGERQRRSAHGAPCVQSLVTAHCADDVGGLRQRRRDHDMSMVCMEIKGSKRQKMMMNLFKTTASWTTFSRRLPRSTPNSRPRARPSLAHSVTRS